jgi:hypothetical protein
LQNKEFTDWTKEIARRKTLKANQEDMEDDRQNFHNLGKRKVGLEGIDVEKVLDVMKLRKIENKRMGFWENHSENFKKQQLIMEGEANALKNGDEKISNIDQMLEEGASTSSQLGLENLLKIPNNWRIIVEEMGESESRLKKVIEVSEVMERWLKAKIKTERGLFIYNSNAFEPEIINI